MWLGEVFEKSVSATFTYYIDGKLTYREAKTYCCEQILKCILARMKELKDRNLSTNDMHLINSEAGKILDHLCNKYPQTDTVDVNKKIKNMIKDLNINNWEDDEYDLLRKSGVQLRLREDGNYSKEIMMYLNHLITLPYQKSNQEMTNFQYFEKVMSRIFNVIMFKNRGKDLSKVVDENGDFNIHPKLKERKSLTEEEIEYMEKV